MVAAVEVVVDVDLPVAAHVVGAARDERERCGLHRLRGARRERASCGSSGGGSSPRWMKTSGPQAADGGRLQGEAVAVEDVARARGAAPCQAAVQAVGPAVVRAGQLRERSLALADLARRDGGRRCGRRAASRPGRAARRRGSIGEAPREVVAGRATWSTRPTACQLRPEDALALQAEELRLDVPRRRRRPRALDRDRRVEARQLPREARSGLIREHPLGRQPARAAEDPRARVRSRRRPGRDRRSASRGGPSPRPGA